MYWPSSSNRPAEMSASSPRTRDQDSWVSAPAAAGSPDCRRTRLQGRAMGGRLGRGRGYQLRALLGVGGVGVAERQLGTVADRSDPCPRRRRSGPLWPRPDASSVPPPLRSPRAAWLPRLVPWQGPPRPLWPSPVSGGSCFAASANAPGLPWTIGSLLLHRIDRRLARGVYLREAERYLAGLAVDSAVRAPTDQLDPGDEVAERLRAPVGCLLERASSVGSDSGHA